MTATSFSSFSMDVRRETQDECLVMAPHQDPPLKAILRIGPC